MSTTILAPNAAEPGMRRELGGSSSRDPQLFRELVERIRSENHEVILNLTGVTAQVPQNVCRTRSLGCGGSA
jgi:uncharacterized protein (DUF849 family)